MKAGYLIGLFMLLPVSNANATVITLYDNRADFISALGGASTQTQDFSGFAADTSLAGVELVPGVTSTFTRGTNTSAPIAKFGGMFRDTSLSGQGNSSIFEFLINGAFSAFGFDVRSHDPATPGPVGFEVVASDGTTETTSFIPTNPTESDPYFFGVIADAGLDIIRYGEGPENGGTSTGLFTRTNCCEETVLDDLVAASVVSAPEPGILSLMAAGLLGLFGFRRRHIK